MINDIKNIKYVFFAELIIICIIVTYIGTLTPVIARDLNANLFLMGVASSIYSFALFVTAITTGKLVQLFNYKKVLLIGIILSSLGNLGLFFSYRFYVFMFFYLIHGIGFGFVFISINSFICDCYPSHKNKLLFFINSGWLVGIFISPLLANAILWLKLTWRATFLCLFILQVLMIFLISKIKFKINDKIENTKIFSIIKNNTFIRHQLILSLAISFLNGSIIDTFSFWFTTYFQSINISVKTSSIFLSIFSASLIIGMFVKKFLLNHIDIKKISFYSATISFIFLLLAFLADAVILKMVFIFIFGINLAGFLTIAFSIGTENSNANSGLLLGLIHGVGYLGPLFFQSLVGYFSNYVSKSFILYLDLTLLFVLCITVSIPLVKKRVRH